MNGSHALKRKVRARGFWGGISGDCEQRAVQSSLRMVPEKSERGPGYRFARCGAFEGEEDQSELYSASRCVRVWACAGLPTPHLYLRCCALVSRPRTATADAAATQERSLGEKGSSITQIGTRSY